MSGVGKFESRLHATETMLQTMFCTVTADLILFPAAVQALREEGVLTDKTVDRIAIDAQLRLQQFDDTALSKPMAADIAKQLDSLAERLRAAAPSRPVIDRPASAVSPSAQTAPGR